MPRRQKKTLQELLINDVAIPASLRLVESNNERIVLEGMYPVNAKMEGYQHIDKQLRLRIEVEKGFPDILPRIIDPGEHIPRSLDYHTYKDGSFCLGSELNLKATIANDPSIGNFLYKCVEPFLYSVLHKQKYGVIPFELAHGADGLVDDYELLFGVKGEEAVWHTIALLGKKKRIANKLHCPCECGLRVGKCDLHIILNKLRKVGSRRSYLTYLQTNLIAPTSKPKKETKSKP